MKSLPTILFALIVLAGCAGTASKPVVTSVAPASAPAPSPAPSEKRIASKVLSANKQQSQQAFLEGALNYMKGDYEKARENWRNSLALDPGNDDARDGLKKIATLYDGAQ